MVLDAYHIVGVKSGAKGIEVSLGEVFDVDIVNDRTEIRLAGIECCRSDSGLRVVFDERHSEIGRSYCDVRRLKGNI